MAVLVFDSISDLTAWPGQIFSDDIVQIGLNAIIRDDSGIAFTSSDVFGGNRVLFNILGSIAASQQAIRFGATDSSHSGTANDVSISVAETGSVAGLNTINIYGNNISISNMGQITGQSAALYLGGSLNSGTQTTIYNSGLIAGQGTAVFIYEFNREAIWVENHGVIGLNPRIAAFRAPDSALSNDVFRNSGLVLGDIELGGGRDLFDARGGELVGEVYGGIGNDTFIPGAQEESFFGDAGLDTLDLRHIRGAGVAIYLDHSQDHSGVAEGDYYTGIEDIIGTRRSADVLQGDAASNTFRGLGGGDVMLGAAGSDFLNGGRNVDSVYGGIGNDRIYIGGVADAGDLIFDFSSNAAGNDDMLMVSKAGFSLNLTAGQTIGSGNLIQRADNIAQQADDIFIFRTTDRTLWVDRDGNNAGAAVLLVDLQAGATVAFTDIWIY